MNSESAFLPSTLDTFCFLLSHTVSWTPTLGFPAITKKSYICNFILLLLFHYPKFHLLWPPSFSHTKPWQFFFCIIFVPSLFHCPILGLVPAFSSSCLHCYTILLPGFSMFSIFPKPLVLKFTLSMATQWIFLKIILILTFPTHTFPDFRYFEHKTPTT